jgi:membrane-anchored protein YejM (alkaline phosphatase superfamily)
MNRRKFALSWGRKIFFGISWPLSVVLTLVYLKSFILPSTATDLFYFVTTLIGHTGLLTAITFFLLYCPVVLLLPTYYVSRLWSLFLIAALNLFILIDALSFSHYHLHVYSYISKLVLEFGLDHLLGSNVGLMILLGGVLVLSILIWIRGEMIWRSMQGRFSNPVKNWYLLFIVLCVVISKSLFHYGDIHPKLAETFTLNLNFARPEKSYHDNRRFYYPKGELQCQGKQNPNLVMIVLKEWSMDQFNADSMPKTFHMKKHAMTYLSHRGVTDEAEAGMFSLIYSLPSAYMSSAKDTLPVLMTELSNRKYELVHFMVDPSITDSTSRDTSAMTQFREWTTNRSGEEINSHFILLTLDQHSSLADKDIQEVILQLQKDDILKNSYVLITGKYSSNGESIPLLLVSPDRKAGEVQHVTTQYDVIPTLMAKGWGCKKSFKTTGFGESLDHDQRDWFLVTTHEGFRIVDVTNNGVMSVVNGNITTSGSPRRELIFPALRQLTKFYRPD